MAAVNGMRAIAVTIAFGLAAAALFVLVPEIDLAAARLLYAEDTGFVLADTPFSVAWGKATRTLAKAIIVLLIAGFVLTLFRKRSVLGLDGRRFLFLLLCFGIATGVVAEAVFKANWGRARPSQVTEFAGTKQFTRAFQIADQCPTNCAFVSGDASFAFATIAFAVLASRRRRLFVAAALTFGLAIGAMRMSTGSHFLSDVVFAGVFSVLIVLLLERVMLARQRFDGPRPDR
jgi:lipid A 4'-phosphatase